MTRPVSQPAERERLAALLAEALHVTCDWEHYMGHEPSERDEMLAAGMAGWLGERGYAVARHTSSSATAEKLAEIIGEEGCSHYRPGLRGARSFADRLIAAGVRLSGDDEGLRAALAVIDGLQDALRDACALLPADRYPLLREATQRWYTATDRDLRAAITPPATGEPSEL